MVEILADEAKGQVPILAGAGGYDTRELIHLGGEMARAGASGFLSVTPYSNKPTQEGLYQHYRAFAESTPLPIVVYNVPGRTGVNVEVATLARLAEIPNIVGVKEASGNMSQMCDVCRGPGGLPRPLGRRCADAAADGDGRPRDHLGGGERDSGGDGPDGGGGGANDFRAARDVHARIVPLMPVNFIESNPVPVKAAMAAMGLLDEVYRLPMVSPKPESKEKIVNVLKELGLLNVVVGH